jgi:hypothetical protein
MTTGHIPVIEHPARASGWLDLLAQLMPPTVTLEATAIYAPDEPEYLSDAVEAIDGFMADVDRVAARSIVLRAGCVPVPSLKVVGAGGIEPPTPTMST